MVRQTSLCTYFDFDKNKKITFDIYVKRAERYILDCVPIVIKFFEVSVSVVQSNESIFDRSTKPSRTLAWNLGRFQCRNSNLD
jgi:hypothetical protein